MRRTLIKIVAIIILSFLCCRYFDYSKSTIISSDFILSSSLEILGIALAVTAIFFTVIDRYKDRQKDKKSIEKSCFPILKEMCDNVLGILILAIIVFITAIIDPLLKTISLPKNIGEFSIALFISLTCFSLILLIVYDITVSISQLIKALFISPPKESLDEHRYDLLVAVCEKLDKKHFEELLAYLKTLYVKQSLENNKKESSDKAD